MYSNANRNDDLNTLIILYENESRINLDGDLYKNTWLSKPTTLGDVAFIQIFKIIQKKIKEISFGEKLHYNDESFKLKYDLFMNEINKNKLIEKVCTALQSGTNTKKDVAILILLELANSQRINKILSSQEFMKIFIEHANTIKRYSKDQYFFFKFFYFFIFSQNNLSF